MNDLTYINYKLKEKASDQKYKSELCNNFILKGSCGYGSKCRFAHGIEDLSKNKRLNVKSHAECQSYQILGFCPKGDLCDMTHKRNIGRTNEEESILMLLSNYKPFSNKNFKRLDIFTKLSYYSSTGPSSSRTSMNDSL